MDNDDDFTFCQVGPPVNQDKFEVQKVISDVSSIKIKDESPNGADSGIKNGIVWNGKLPSNVNSQKQATVGSLKFKVIDASSQEKMTDRAENSLKTSQGRKSAVRKPAPRAKVPFEKGYSPMDWLKLNQTHPDLAGNKGKSNKRLISLSEVKQHQTEGSMWTVLKGRVYNIAPYMKFHPGGDLPAMVDLTTQKEHDLCHSQHHQRNASDPIDDAPAVAKHVVQISKNRRGCPGLPLVGLVRGGVHLLLPPRTLEGLEEWNDMDEGPYAISSVDMLMKGVGKDCTSLFNKYHAWVNAEFLLEKCLVGILDDSQ